jgi:hypothetical protein
VPGRQFLVGELDGEEDGDGLDAGGEDDGVGLGDEGGVDDGPDDGTDGGCGTDDEPVTGCEVVPEDGGWVTVVRPGADDGAPLPGAFEVGEVGGPGFFLFFFLVFVTAVGPPGLAGGMYPVSVIVGSAPLVMPTGNPVSGIPAA